VKIGRFSLADIIQAVKQKIAVIFQKYLSELVKKVTNRLKRDLTFPAKFLFSGINFG